MEPLQPLPVVSIRDLIRRPGEFIDRIEDGERLVVSRYNRPVATLQPIDGWVGYRNGPPTDIHGEPLGDPAHEVSKLAPHQRAMLLGVNRLGRYIHTGSKDYRRLMGDMVLRGLARKSSPRGMVITGRGMVLKEWLEKREARREKEREKNGGGG